jgi:hypothetical protein
MNKREASIQIRRRKMEVEDVQPAVPASTSYKKRESKSYNTSWKDTDSESSEDEYDGSYMLFAVKGKQVSPEPSLLSDDEVIDYSSKNEEVIDYSSKNEEVIDYSSKNEEEKRILASP